MSRVLVACEFSGIVRDAFLAAGHDAMSCDLLPSEQPGPHIQGDAFEAIQSFRPELLIAHPPCTYLANSGVRWLYGGKGTVPADAPRWQAMIEAALFFRRLLNTGPSAGPWYVAVENPIMHRYAREIVGGGPDQLIQPWMFGTGETKATGLWLRGLPPLTPTDIVDGRHARVHLAAPSPTRWMDRSRTDPGIAAAMADQWGALLLERVA